MNEFEQIYSIIDDINDQVKKIDNEVSYIETLSGIIEEMGEYSVDIKKYHKETLEAYNSAISRIKTLNGLIEDELLADYEYIFKELNSKCSDIIEDLIQNANTESTISSQPEKIEVLDITPITSEATDATLTSEILRPDIIADKKIPSIEKHDETIPLPTPVEPEIEVLDM